MINGAARNRNPFTASQWQELEHQALIFKYMVSGVPIPPELLCSVKTSLGSSMSAARLFSHQPAGWGCLQVGLGRKLDPEPGRCRRTDGKKWRCSKEAFPNAKYCERHMHRGKSRSRKPVEVTNTTTNISPPPISSITTTTTTSSSYSVYPQTHLPHHHPYENRLPGFDLLSPPNNPTHHQFLHSGTYAQPEKDYRHFQELRERVDELIFFPEASGTARVLSDQSYSTPLTGSYTSLSDNSKEEQHHSFVLGTDFNSIASRQNRVERVDDDDDEIQKPLHHFFSEWPQKNNRDSWLDHLEDDPSTHSSFSTTQLSISLPMSSHHDLL